MMHSRSVFLFLGVAWLASAVPKPGPLNINLGAYSPALVVGDGEISFAGSIGAGKAAGAGAEAVATAEATEGLGPVQTVDPVASPGQATGGEAAPVTDEQQSSITAQDNTLLQWEGMGKQRLPKD